MHMNSEVLENLNMIKKIIVILSEGRKIVLYHQKKFKHVEQMRNIVSEAIEKAKSEK